jgi:hypothetical protein
VSFSWTRSVSPSSFFPFFSFFASLSAMRLGVVLNNRSKSSLMAGWTVLAQ